MIHVDPSHFSNVIVAVQRTGSLTGGSVRGLPNGVVIDGLKGIHSFASDITDAQKEYQLGRIRNSLERTRQIEIQFNGILGRWNASVGSLIASARQGRQQLPLQKLNEVKNAQTKMQQLAGPACKAFQDLISALEHEVATESHETEDAPGDAVPRVERGAELERSTSELVGSSDAAESLMPGKPAAASQHRKRDEETPDEDLLGSFAANYRFGPRLRLQRGSSKKSRIVPQLESGKFYFVAGLHPPRVIRVRDVKAKGVLVFDTLQSDEAILEASELAVLLRQGIWLLVK